MSQARRVAPLVRFGLFLLASGCPILPTLAQESSLLHRRPNGGGVARQGQPRLASRPPASFRSAATPNASAAPQAVALRPAAAGAPNRSAAMPPQAGTGLQARGPASNAPLSAPRRRTAPTSSLAEASWMYSPAMPPRQFRMNDIVTIRVDEIAQASAEGAAENRKNSLYDAILKDWISLSGGFLKPAAQSDGDPRVNGQLNSLYRADASIESRESLTFNIAARVVDIRPNGNLVLEAHKTIWVNDNAFETSLVGICRAQDIGPDNVLLSRDLLDPQIRKSERGRLRDGYRRGWFQRWFEEFQPF